MNLIVKIDIPTSSIGAKNVIKKRHAIDVKRFFLLEKLSIEGL